MAVNQALLLLRDLVRVQIWSTQGGFLIAFLPWPRQLKLTDRETRKLQLAVVSEWVTSVTKLEVPRLSSLLRWRFLSRTLSAVRCLPANMNVMQLVGRSSKNE